MVNALNVKNKIDVKVFSALGSTASLQAKASQTMDKWGDATPTYGTAANIVVVPWFNIDSKRLFESFGDVAPGELDFAVKSDQSINVDDKLTWKGKLYKVKVIEYYTLKDTLLVKAIRVTEALN